MSESPSHRFSLDKTVFYPALLLLFGGISLVLVLPSGGTSPFVALQSVIVTTARWFYVLIVALIAVLVFVVAISRYGDIKLGPDHAEPDYGFLSWFSMLFAAGVGGYLAPRQWTPSLWRQIRGVKRGASRRAQHHQFDRTASSM